MPFGKQIQNLIFLEETILKQILEQRIRHDGLSIREAARKIGTAPVTISRFMNDEPCDLWTGVGSIGNGLCEEASHRFIHGG